MSQPEISPLARRLAEENNVDWRGLHGSGAGGKVVERDVLEFLARVMAGEEDVDPTPEPVPDGMESWPEEDVRSFQQEVQASRRDAGLDEIQQELSAADRLGGGAVDVGPGPTSSGEAPARADAEEISEDIFLFGDDADEEPPTPPEPADRSRPEAFGDARSAEAPEEDELLVAGEDEYGADALEGEPLGGALRQADAGAGSAGEGRDEGLFEAAEGPSAAPHAEDETLFEPGRDAASGAGEPARSTVEGADELPDIFGGEAEGEEQPRAAGAGSALFADEGAGAADDALEVPSLGEVDAGENDEVAPAGWASRDEARVDAGAAGPAWDVEAESPHAHGDAGAGEPAWDIEAEPADEARPPLAEEQEPSAYGPSAYPTAGSPGAEGAVPGSPPFGGDAMAGGEALAGEETLAGGELSGPEVPPSPRELPLVSYGALLRRHVDVTALAGAQLAVGLELGEGEPLSPAPFLVRSAAKAVAEQDWGDGSVAFVTFGEGGSVLPRRLEGADRMPFVELMHTLNAAAGDQASAALNVVDMSALDVDEAVLDVDGPQLTLGRILYDNQRGSYRSTLSLAGDVPADRGARLLSRVAELLDAPVRLML